MKKKSPVSLMVVRREKCEIDDMHASRELHEQIVMWFLKFAR